MGLDVYLEKCADFSAMCAARAQADREIEALWDGLDFSQLSEERKKALCDEQQGIPLRLGLGEPYGCGHGSSRIKQDSLVHPNHLFKVGYFRSSYNGGGFDSVMGRKGLPTLDEILLAVEEHGGYVRCDWVQAKQRASAALAQYQTLQGSLLGRLDVLQVSANLFDPDHGPRDEREALAVAARLLERPRRDDHGFSCKDGEVYPLGLKVLALLPGKDTTFKEPLPCTYVVYERPAQDKPDWYLQALQVVNETLDFILADPHPEHFHLVWSS